jgi:dimethylargininase
LSALLGAATPKAFASSPPSRSAQLQVIACPSPAPCIKSAVTHIGGNTLANRAWFDTASFAAYDWIDLDPAEPHAANALAFGGTTIFPASFPLTNARLQGKGFHVTPIDISELQKAESGLTCSSLLFDAPAPP